MMDASHYALLGLIEGITEFLPVSSTGHLILARTVFGLNTPDGLAVDAVLQLATTLAVVLYFRRDLFKLLNTGLAMLFGKPTTEGERGLVAAIIVGSVPALILGFFLERMMETAFRSAFLVACTLVAGGIVMAVAEYFWSRAKGSQGPVELSETGGKRGFVIGLFQALALVPGMSRSGMAIAGGLFLGLSRDAAARFAFLLSVPILTGSGLKKLLDLWQGGVLSTIGPELLVGSAVAFVSGLVAIHALLLFVRTNSLYPFVLYRFALAAAIFFVL